MDIFYSQWAGEPLWAWLIFSVLVLTGILVDLFRGEREQTPKEAAAWCALWFGLAVGFGIGLVFHKGFDPASEFGTAYLIEKALSADNVFLFLVLFNYFKIPIPVQRRVLFWGVFGAIAMRTLLFWSGVAIISQFHWVLYGFAVFLIQAGLRMGFSKDEDYNPDESWVIKFARRRLRVSTELDGGNFFTVQNGKHLATPLLLTLVAVEVTDLLFAFDSIPACMAVSSDLFVLLTSNIFAILGLRSLYFLLAGYMEGLRFLQPCLAFLLVFIGAEMLVKAATGKELHSAITLGISVAALGLAVFLSLRYPQKKGTES